jgi:hypothetical protein
MRKRWWTPWNKLVFASCLLPTSALYAFVGSPFGTSRLVGSALIAVWLMVVVWAIRTDRAKGSSAGPAGSAGAGAGRRPVA